MISKTNHNCHYNYKQPELPLKLKKLKTDLGTISTTMRFDFFLFLFFRFNLILRELMFAITGQFVTSQVGWIIKIARAFRTFIIYSLMFLFVTPQRRMGTESRFRTVCVCLDEFYFRWLEKDIIGIVKAVSIPLILNHLKWKPS